MRAGLALRHDDAWTRRVTRMVGLSTAAHVGIFVLAAVFGAWLAARRPEPIVAYSVELTDFPGTGGRLPGGPGNDLIGRSPPAPKVKPSAAPPAPAPAAPKPPEPVAAPQPPPAPPSEPKVAAKPAPPKPPPPKPTPAAEPLAKAAPKIEPKKIEAKKVEPPKPPAKPAEAAKPAEPPPAKPAAEKAAPAAAASAATSAKPTGAADDYASAAERFRERMAKAGTGAGAPGEGVAGGGPGGGVLGVGGDGRGGGQVKSLEWLAYKQRIINLVKERWSNAIKRPGLLATVHFRIARDGTISAVRVTRPSGNDVYDQTAVAAVERVQQLPPPPPAYADEFADFEINFHGDEMGGVS